MAGGSIVSKEKEDMNGLGEADKVVDMGDLNGDPIPQDKEVPD